MNLSYHILHKNLLPLADVIVVCAAAIETSSLDTAPVYATVVEVAAREFAAEFRRISESSDGEIHPLRDDAVDAISDVRFGAKTIGDDKREEYRK